MGRLSSMAANTDQASGIVSTFNYPNNHSKPPPTWKDAQQIQHSAKVYLSKYTQKSNFQDKLTLYKALINSDSIRTNPNIVRSLLLRKSGDALLIFKNEMALNQCIQQG